MRSDHLSKHIRTHSNQRQSAAARAEMIGQTVTTVASVVGQQIIINPVNTQQI